MGRIWQFFRSWEPRGWAALVVMTVCLWGAIGILDGVRDGETERWDRWLLKAAREPGNLGTMRGPSWLPGMVRDVTALGSVTVLAGVTAMVAGFLWLSRKRQTAVFLAVAIVSGSLMVAALKSVVERPRPDVVPHLAEVSSTSFPSGHSMMSAVTYLTMGGLLMAVVEGRWLKLYVLCVAAVLAILIGISRVLLGVHYPSDVLAGWTFGLAWSELCWLAHAIWTGRIRRAGDFGEDAAGETGAA